MLNEKALRAAARALREVDETLGDQPHQVWETYAEAAIEAFIATLYDEGGLVARTRRTADDLRGLGKDDIARVLRELADALEVVRGKPSAVRDLVKALEQLRDWRNSLVASDLDMLIAKTQDPLDIIEPALAAAPESPE